MAGGARPAVPSRPARHRRRNRSWPRAPRASARRRCRPGGAVLPARTAGAALLRGPADPPAVSLTPPGRRRGLSSGEHERLSSRGASLRLRPGRRAAPGGLSAGRVDRARLLSWRPSSASRCSSRDPPASARPSSPRRSPRYLGRELVRLQCYEGLDEAKALYEWNYRKQLLRIQAEASGTGWDAVQEDIFGEEFLLARPLMSAIASEQPVVLLIDEIDKTDQEFEAMLLEVLSDFQISIPELGPRGLAHAPDRAAHLEQLARADRGAQAPLPVPVARLPRRSSTSSRSCACTRRSWRRRSRAGWSR